MPKMIKRVESLKEIHKRERARSRSPLTDRWGGRVFVRSSWFRFRPSDGRRPRVYYRTSDAKFSDTDEGQEKKMNASLGKLASVTRAQWEDILK